LVLSIGVDESGRGRVGTFLALYINCGGSQTCRMKLKRLAAYEEPHAGTEASGSESVERADGVDVDGVGAVGSTGTSGTSHCVCAQLEKRSSWAALAIGQDAYVKGGGSEWCWVDVAVDEVNRLVLGKQQSRRRAFAGQRGDAMTLGVCPSFAIHQDFILLLSPISVPPFALASRSAFLSQQARNIHHRSSTRARSSHAMTID